MAFDIELLRQDFPYLKQKVNGKKIAYLDNAATTQKPFSVIAAISDYYSKANANPHRGGNALAAEATEKYENARKRVAKFIGAAPDEIIFTKNATESLNLVARMAGKTGGRVLLSQMEHHSNIVPWQLAGARLEFAGLNEEMKIDLQDAKEKLAKGQPHVFSFAHASNVLGCVNDAQKLCRMARKSGALSCVDAAQTVPHMKVDVKEIGCDFLAFSGHKMLGPDGLGVLYIRREVAQALAPVFGGGGAIEKVGWKKSSLAKPPYRFEPGTQNSAGAVGLSAAIDYLEKVGWKNIGKHCGELQDVCREELARVKGMRFHGEGRETGIVSFNVGKAHAHDVGQIASDAGVMVRAGHHCAQPLMGILGEAATVRASFYIYNTEEEAGRLAKAVKRASELLG